MTRRLVVVALIASLVLVLGAGIATAQEEGDEGTTETTVQVDSGGAAVPLPPLEEADDSEPWTARFIPPTLALLTVLIIGGALAYHFFFIRGRYEVVDG